MRRLSALLALALLLLFSGCELFESISKPRVHLVSLAFNYYGEGSLKGPVNDQECIYRAFRAMYDSRGYEFSATLLNDNGHRLERKRFAAGTETDTVLAASAQSCHNVFSTLLPQILDEEDIEDGDITIFFYSGHGEDDSGDLIGPDVSEALAPDELFSLISALPGYKLMIVDACFSGRHSFSEEQNSSVTEAYSSLFSNSSPSLSYTWGVFASQDNEYSAEFNADEALESLGWLRPHGAFTASILMHLGMDMSTESISVPNRAITAEGIFNAACRALDDNSTVLGVSVEHTPSESSNFFDLVLFSPDI